MAIGPHVLVIDDEPQIQRFLRPSLAAEGYAVVSAASSAEALRQLRQHMPDVVVLDLGLPDADGKEIIRAVRATSKVPIVVLSARDQEAEKIAALDLGADDYVNKPFAIGEFMARLRAALRHAAASETPNTLFKTGNLVVDTAAYRVTLKGEPVRLTPKEYDLLHLLAQHPGRVVTQRQILTLVWGPAHGGDVQYLRVLVRRLRQKIEADVADPKIILTEPGVGYRLAD